jgi:GNAT superfamily N-acetyltransferase
MALEDGYRGQGLGKIFFQKAEEICKDRKIPSIRVDTFE